MSPDDRHLPHAFRARGPQVVLAHHLEHGGARHSGHKGEVSEGQRQGREDQLLQVQQRIFPQRGIAQGR